MNAHTLAVSLLFALSASEMFAEQTIKAPILVTVSGQTIMQKSLEGQKVFSKLQAEQEKLSKALIKDEDTLRAKEKALFEKNKALEKKAEETANSKLLSQEAKQKKFEEIQDEARLLEEDRLEIEKLRKRMQAERNRIDAKMSQMYQEEMTKLDKKIRTKIGEIARHQGWDIVFMEETTVYVASHLSKTDFVIKELDGTTKKDEEATKKATSK